MNEVFGKEGNQEEEEKKKKTLLGDENPSNIHP